MATGLMTLANEALNGNQPLSSAADKVNWKVVPATLVAAGIFYGLEQAIGDAAKALAWLVFFTAFVGGDALQNPDLNWFGQSHTTPLGTLMEVFGLSNSTIFNAPQGSPRIIGGLPYTEGPYSGPTN